MMKNTVTISIEEFDQLRNSFENSKLKNRLESEIKNKNQEIESLCKEINSIKNTDFFCVKYDGLFFNQKNYFRKDKTPLWIRRIFN